MISELELQSDHPEAAFILHHLLQTESFGQRGSAGSPTRALGVTVGAKITRSFSRAPEP